MVSVSIAFLSHRPLGFRKTIFKVLPSLGFLCLSDFYLSHPPASTQQNISVSTLGPSTTYSIPLPRLLSFKVYESDLFPADFPSPTTCLVLRSAFSTSPIAAVKTYVRRPMFVFSDAIKLPRRHITVSVSYQFLGALLFQQVSLASISIATIPQSGPRLRFWATPLVPCPFPIQPSPAPFVVVAERTFIRKSCILRALRFSCQFSLKK